MSLANLSDVASHFATIGSACDNSGSAMLLSANSELAVSIMDSILSRGDAIPNEIILPLLRQRGGSTIIVGFLLASDTNIKLLMANGRRRQSMHVRPRDGAPILTAAIFTDNIMAIWLRRIENHLMIYVFSVAAIMNPLCNETRWCSVPFDRIIDSSIEADRIQVQSGDRSFFIRYRDREYELEE